MRKNQYTLVTFCTVRSELAANCESFWGKEDPSGMHFSDLCQCTAALLPPCVPWSDFFSFISAEASFNFKIIGIFIFCTTPNIPAMVIDYQLDHQSFSMHLTLTFIRWSTALYPIQMGHTTFKQWFPLGMSRIFEGVGLDVFKHRAQSSTSLMADLCHDINIISSSSRGAAFLEHFQFLH